MLKRKVAKCQDNRKEKVVLLIENVLLVQAISLHARDWSVSKILNIITLLTCKHSTDSQTTNETWKRKRRKISQDKKQEWGVKKQSEQEKTKHVQSV